MQLWRQCDVTLWVGVGVDKARSHSVLVEGGIVVWAGDVTMQFEVYFAADGKHLDFQIPKETWESIILLS